MGRCDDRDGAGEQPRAVIPGGFATRLACWLAADQVSTIENAMASLAAAEGPERRANVMVDPWHIAGVVR